VEVSNNGKLSMFFYGGAEFIMAVKSFIEQASGENFTKLFLAFILEWALLTRVFVPGKSYQPNIMFASKAGTYLTWSLPVPHGVTFE
jgi:hypothetical protein